MNIGYDVLLERAEQAHLHKNTSFYSGKTGMGVHIESDNPIVANLERMRENFDVPDGSESDQFLVVTNTNRKRHIQEVS